MKIEINNLNNFTVFSYMEGEDLSFNVNVGIRDVTLEEYSKLHKLMFEKNTKMYLTIEQDIDCQEVAE